MRLLALQSRRCELAAKGAWGWANGPGRTEPAGEVAAVNAPTGILPAAVPSLHHMSSYI